MPSLKWNPDDLTPRQKSRIPQGSIKLSTYFWEAVELAPNEKEFQALIIQAAKRYGWMVQHSAKVQDSKGNHRTPIHGHAGFPDLVLARQDAILFVELKTNKGRIKDKQQQWANAIISACQESHNVHYKLWRPRDAQAIREALE